MEGNRCIALVGSGGHASVVKEVATSIGMRVCGVFECFDGSLSVIEGNWEDHRERHLESENAWAIAVGDGPLRLSLAERVASEHPTANFPSLVSKTAHVSESAVLGQGCVVLPLANIGPEAFLGDFTIVNSLANLEHHGRLGRGSHLAPGSTVLGGGEVGELSLIASGSVVERKAKFPEHSTLAAMSFFSAGMGSGLYVGAPAKLAKAPEGKKID
jgi:acetyltransferase-like isoleucine patch superfamily enzyme